MAARRGRLIVLGLTIVLVASLWRLVAVERENQRVTEAYSQATRTVKELEGERTHLSDQLADSRETVAGQADGLANLQHELEGVETELQQTQGALSALEREHQELLQQHTASTERLGVVEEEKRQLEAKLSSLKELKLAIKNVKRTIWNERWATWRARIQAQHIADQERLASGNRGYVVRDGASTLVSPSRLQVHVLEPQLQ